MRRPRIIVTRRWPEAVEQALQARFDVTLNANDHPFSAEEMRHALTGFDAVLTTVSDRIDGGLLRAAPLRCRLLASYGVGYNHIDIDAARELGLCVTNTPDVLTDCTADLALTLMLMVARRAGEGERQVRSGQWKGWRPTHMIGTRLSGKTLGIIGMGRIAHAVAVRAHHGFGMKIVFFNRSRVEPARLAGLQAEQCDTVDEVLAQSDFVSLHCPGGADTRHLIDRERLARMQPHAFLINTARGEVVDEIALAEALQRGTIAGAGLDVYAAEPSVTPALLKMENVVLLPHLGSATRETREGMGMRVVDNVSAFFDGHEPPDRVV
ncbi:D-glycerate dehydrogenase [Azoarcus sp. L1K30]|uniref:2-hydroxyacid dehydrogenase n=1 Tax=Azoarcus sp. L1K30 TaxID=2820277 RepID=UPI001B840DBD|nr:D-glycerate dehydrogenase [Azoarcus sp. L1K30]MBR0566781.1 D-glycerate dehydrogenase [Azoarcus sp. L1K30]